MKYDDQFIDGLLKHHDLPKVLAVKPIGGGCISAAYRIDTAEASLFLKVNQNSADLFRKEAHGLQLLCSHTNLTVPEVIHRGNFLGKDYIMMQFIGDAAPVFDFWKQFAVGLAGLHRCSNEAFGLGEDNYIGSLPQSNKWNNSWSDFFAENRLEPQVRMAVDSGKLDVSLRSEFDRLYPKLSALVPAEPPALIHGDLWSGNFKTDGEGLPAIFDPAVHYGHRETELAFTRMFGGFDQSFYQAYQEAYPLEHGFENRVDLHNLYPQLVHVNLFGGGYVGGLVKMLKKYL